jgi:hypothetical protein
MDARFLVEDASGRKLARAWSAAGAHRATRRAKFAGSHVNRADGVVVRNLSERLAAVLPIERDKIEAALRAVTDFLAQIGVHEKPAEIGYRHVIEAEWFYALGPREKHRFMEIVRLAADLGRKLKWAEFKWDPEDAERLTKTMQDLVKEVEWVETVIRSAKDEFQRGDFTIIPMKGVSRKAMEDALSALDKASSFVRVKFPQLLYGKVFIGKSVGHSKVASYVRDHDTIQLSLRAKRTVGDVHAICHELGHRFYHRFFANQDLRQEFYVLSTQRVYETVSFDMATRGRLADEFVELAKSKERRKGSDLLHQWLDYRMKSDLALLRQRSLAVSLGEGEAAERALWDAVVWTDGPANVEVSTDKIIREPLAVTAYGKKSPEENFAEAFSFYVRGELLAPEISAVMERL